MTESSSTILLHCRLNGSQLTGSSISSTFQISIWSLVQIMRQHKLVGAGNGFHHTADWQIGKLVPLQFQNWPAMNHSSQCFYVSMYTGGLQSLYSITEMFRPGTTLPGDLCIQLLDWTVALTTGDTDCSQTLQSPKLNFHQQILIQPGWLDSCSNPPITVFSCSTAPLIAFE